MFYGEKMEKRAEKSEEQSSVPKIIIRKIYKKPRIQDLGDLRSLTLGSSPGIFESGLTRDPTRE
jgi:hypothetical protein